MTRTYAISWPGAVFNPRMHSNTIAEDGLMIGRSSGMLISMI